MNYSGSATNNIICTDNGDLVCSIADSLGLLNSATGEYLWKVQAQANYKNKVITPDGLIELFDQWTGAHFYNISNGIEKYVLNLYDPLLVDDDGNFYKVSSTQISVFNNSEEELYSTPFAGANANTLTLSNESVFYFVSGDKVYAIQGVAPLAKNGWPCASHDNRNTFNYSKH